MKTENTNNTKKPKNTFQRVFKINLSFKDIILWLLLFLVAFSLFSAFRDPAANIKEETLSEAVGNIKEGEVGKLKIGETQLIMTYKNGEERILLLVCINSSPVKIRYCPMRQAVIFSFWIRAGLYTLR